METYMLVLSVIFLTLTFLLLIYGLVTFSIFNKVTCNDNARINGKALVLLTTIYVIFSWFFLIFSISEVQQKEHLAVFKGTSNYEVVVEKNVNHDIKYKDGLPVDTVETITYDTTVVAK